VAEGEIPELHVGLKGTMNALFLKDLAAKTCRGLRGRVEKGKAGGGLCYGYDGNFRRVRSSDPRIGANVPDSYQYAPTNRSALGENPWRCRTCRAMWL
jgi:hypothetical protein